MVWYGGHAEAPLVILRCALLKVTENCSLWPFCVCAIRLDEHLCLVPKREEVNDAQSAAHEPD